MSVSIDGGSSSSLTGLVTINGQIQTPVTSNNVFSSNSFNFDCNVAMTQYLDAEAMTGDGSIIFSNLIEGSTYMIVLVQGSGNHNITLQQGYWLNDAVFDFTTLGNDGRCMITCTYINGARYYSVKNLTYV